MVSIRKIISYVLLWSFSHAWLNINTIRQDYDDYLSVFNKKESPTSFEVFKHNFNFISTKEHYYLTQDSDIKYNEFFFSPTVYIYKLKSREQKNQKILLCV